MINLRAADSKVATSGENQRKIPRSMRSYGNTTGHMLAAQIRICFIHRVYSILRDFKNFTGKRLEEEKRSTKFLMTNRSPQKRDKNSRFCKKYARSTSPSNNSPDLEGCKSGNNLPRQKLELRRIFHVSTSSVMSVSLAIVRHIPESTCYNFVKHNRRERSAIYSEIWTSTCFAQRAKTLRTFQLCETFVEQIHCPVENVIARTRPRQIFARLRATTGHQ